MMYLQPRPVNEIMFLENPQTRIDMIIAQERFKTLLYNIGRKISEVFRRVFDGLSHLFKSAWSKIQELAESMSKWMNSIEFKCKKPHRHIVCNYDRNYLKHSSVHGKQNHNKMIKYRRKHR